MNNMSSGSITRHLLRYAIPLILGNILQLLYNAVDSIVIGKFAGEASIAAVSAANPVMTIVILGVSGICIGASVIMSEFFGAGDQKGFQKEVATTILFGLAFSLAIFVLGVLFSRQILIAMNVEESILGMSDQYLKIIFVGFLFTFLYNALSSAMRSIGDSATPVRFLAISSVLNACLDVIFVALFHLGVAGAGLATVLAEAISVILCVLHVYRKMPLLRISKADWKIDGELLKRTLQIGSVTALQQSCQPIGKALIQSCINTQGISMMAAFNAVSRVDDFACIPAQSISHGMMTCVAQNRGAGKLERAYDTFPKGIRLELCYFCLICVATLLLKTPVMRLFAAENSREMVEMGVHYLTLMAFIYVFPPLTNGLQGFFRGWKKMNVVLFATVLQITIRTIVVYILVPRIGLDGVAYACMIGWACMLLFEVPYYGIFIKKNKSN